ncbi:MAG: hypothetical protein QXT38_02090 [Candidatus Aenigmatarchaeota archaeon]
MKLITTYTVNCKKFSKDHRHYISFYLIYKKRDKSYLVYFEEVLNDKTKEEGYIAIFFSKKLARSFLNAIFKSIDNNLEKFKIDKISLKCK